MGVNNPTLHKLIALAAFLFAVSNTVQVAYQIKNSFVNAVRPPPRPKDAKLDDSNVDGLIWFVQVSDLHFSIFIDHDRPKDFLPLCELIKKNIQPQAVILTGDLTDAKTQDKLGSRQFEPEWQLYHDTMRACGAFNQNDIPWLDVRGNHDTFNVNGVKEDKYNLYGIKKDKDRFYSMTIQKHNTSYGLIAMDATLSPGPKRPFNFFGSLSAQELDQFTQVFEDARSKTDFQIVFGHYPTSCVLTPQPGLRSVIGKSASTLAYLCGHLHTLNNLAPHMYSTHNEGFLELELGDWKDNRIFRILAVDQGQLVFKDFIFNSKEPKPKMTIMLNPMDFTYTRPINVEFIKESTHMRILAFVDPDDKLEVKIDGKLSIPLKRSSKDVPLFTAPWNPKSFVDDQEHSIQVILNQKTVLSHSKFTLSDDFTDLGTTSLIAQVVLGLPWSLITQALFGLCAASIVLPLCLIRLRPCHSSKWRLFRGIAKVASNNRQFYAIVSASLYISFGPWAIGYFLGKYKSSYHYRRSKSTSL